MKTYKLILISIVLFFLLSTNSVSAINENINDDFALKNNTIPWTSATFILTPFGDKAHTELIYHFNGPQNFRQEYDISFQQRGTIISDIDFYINNEKMNFSDYFLLETDGEEYFIKSIELSLWHFDGNAPIFNLPHAHQLLHIKFDF